MQSKKGGDAQQRHCKKDKAQSTHRLSSISSFLVCKNIIPLNSLYFSITIYIYIHIYIHLHSVFYQFRLPSFLDLTFNIWGYTYIHIHTYSFKMKHNWGFYCPLYMYNVYNIMYNDKIIECGGLSSLGLLFHLVSHIFKVITYWTQLLVFRFLIFSDIFRLN